MTVVRLSWIAAACLVLASCGEKPVETKQTDNPNVPVGVLFEVDGCKVYRFRDAGEYVYFANCPGSVQSFNTESCGKNCTRKVPVTVPTEGGLGR